MYKKQKGFTRIPGLMQYNEQILNIPESIVRAFAEHFANVYNQSSTNSQHNPSTLQFF